MNNKYQVNNLPHWVLADEHVAFYDTEELTAIKMVARLYSKMQELITTYDEFKNYVDNNIDDFEEDMTNKINEAIQYMKTNLKDTATEILTYMIENDELHVLLTYNENNESLNLILSQVNNEEVNNGV